MVGVSLLLSWSLALKAGAESPDIVRAKSYGAQGKVTLHVTDSAGKCVENAGVSIGFRNPRKRDDRADGVTDPNGLYSAMGTSGGDILYTITKEGFYKTSAAYWFYRQGEDCVQDGRWQPWNPTVAVVLKERRNPIPMYAKNVDVRIPVQDQPVGFDLAKGDWVAPHGEGTTGDLLVKYSGTYEGPGVFSSRLEMAFSNARDGVQPAPLDKTSDLHSVYTAPEEGYAPMFVQEYSRTRTKIFMDQDLAKDQYLIVRVRTVTDQEGRIISANYGKIYGPIEYGRLGGVDRVRFTCYLNPTANDRNLEFDPAQNLIRSTDWRERGPVRP